MELPIPIYTQNLEAIEAAGKYRLTFTGVAYAKIPGNWIAETGVFVKTNWDITTATLTIDVRFSSITFDVATQLAQVAAFMIGGGGMLQSISKIVDDPVTLVIGVLALVGIVYLIARGIRSI